MQEKLPRSLRHLYTVLVVMMGWVIFRADTFTAAGNYFTALFGLGHAPDAQQLPYYVTDEVIWAVIIGIAFTGPLWNWTRTTCVKLRQILPAAHQPVALVLGGILEILLVAGLLVISSAWLAASTYNPFIYFRF
jgi:alginate O-acetyltransferase complex protein AlgI